MDMKKKEFRDRMMSYSTTTYAAISKAISKKNPRRLEAAKAVKEIKSEKELIAKLQELTEM